MKFAAVIHHAPDVDKVKGIQDAHRVYLRGLLDSGQLCAAGPMSDHVGALWVFDAETPEKADEIVRNDPSTAAGVFVSWQIHPLAYWSAKAAKGEK